MKSVPALVKLFQDNGFTLLRQKNHQIWICPCGHKQLISSTSHAEGRGDNNCKARIRRTLRECAERADNGEATQ